jgi:hypothetical protein
VISDSLITTIVELCTVGKTPRCFCRNTATVYTVPTTANLHSVLQKHRGALFFPKHRGAKRLFLSWLPLSGVKSHSAMDETTSSSSSRVVLAEHELCTPANAKKKWWGIIIALLKDHKLLAAAGQADAYCKLCQKLLKYNKNTGNLNDHVESLHKEALKEMLAGAASGGATAGQKQQGQTQMDVYCEQVGCHHSCSI